MLKICGLEYLNIDHLIEPKNYLVRKLIVLSPIFEPYTTLIILIETVSARYGGRCGTITMRSVS